MNLNELIQGLGIALHDPSARSIEIRDVTEDSRRVGPGSLFVARAGSHADGSAFIDEAIRAGAAAVLTSGSSASRPCGPEVAWLTAENVSTALAQLAEQHWGHPSSSLKLVGVTGTNGKTTVAELLRQLLDEPRQRCGLIGTVSVIDGSGETRAAMTTPPAVDLSRALATMVGAGFGSAVIEVSSHALDQGRTAGLSFDAGVYTNLSGDHLDYHRTMDAYAQAKSKLFRSMDERGTAVLNADDPRAEQMVRGFEGGVLRCSLLGRAGATCSAEHGESDLDGTPVRLLGPWGTIEGRSPLIGAFNVANLLVSVAAAHALGRSRASIEGRIGGLRLPIGRLERIDSAEAPSDGPVVFVDYAHTDDALDHLLRALRQVARRRRTRLRVVMGCGGDRDRTKRPRMGGAASRWADAIYVTSDNPRSERPEAIIEDVLRGVDRTRRSIHVEVDRRRAIERAVRESDDGEILVIAGKGHEDYQILSQTEPAEEGGELRRIRFDDREVARAALDERRPAVAGAPEEVLG